MSPNNYLSLLAQMMSLGLASCSLQLQRIPTQNVQEPNSQLGTIMQMIPFLPDWKNPIKS
jgi:hypothetical protein